MAQKDAECEAMIKRVSAEFADVRQVLAARVSPEIERDVDLHGGCRAAALGLREFWRAISGAATPLSRWALSGEPKAQGVHLD